MEIITSNALVTLHYAICLENGKEVISTFDTGMPATLQLGVGEMTPAMEQCLIGLSSGDARVFTLSPAEAFGEHRPELVENVRRRDISEKNLEAMSVMEFSAPDGNRYQAFVREVNDEFARLDFNHPLAGKNIQFRVSIIGLS